MRKILLLSTFIMVFVSCHRDDDNENKIENKININIPVGTIVAKIDGIETTFNINSVADTTLTDDLGSKNNFDLYITGKNDNSNKSKNIKLWLDASGGNIIDPGTYPKTKNGWVLWSTIFFEDIWNNDLYKYQSDTSYPPYTSTVTIVRIDSLVQGVFSANVVIGAGAIGDAQPPFDHKIENGMFNVRIRH